MRKLWPLLLVAACSKSSTDPSAVSTRDADALWALCPETATSGFVVTPRALQHVEAGLVEVQRFLAATPELSMVQARLDGAIRGQLGAAFGGLDEVGLDRTKGMAMFDAPGGGVVVVPLADREKLAKLSIPVGTDPNKIGELTCKTVGGHYACSKNIALLDQIGSAKPPKQINTVGQRGDIEIMLQQPLDVGVTIRVDRGAMVVRGAVVAPPIVVQKLVGSSKPRATPGQTSAFIVATVESLLETMPEGPLLPDLTLSALLATVNGPVTITIAPGTTLPDVRVPLSDTAPAQKVIDACATVVPPEMLAKQQQPGACRVSVATYNVELDIWVDGKELRAGSKAGPPVAKQVRMTALGTEIANGTWTMAFWGRGTMFGSPKIDALAGGMPDQAAMMFRALALLSELGIAVRLDGNVAHVIAGGRTIWANPPDVAQKLLAIPATDIVDGSTASAEALAKSAPSSPFAEDYTSGQGGLMVPTALIGVVASIAIPAFMQYMREPMVAPTAERPLEAPSPAPAPIAP
ncbi:MAG: hypothetical protein ACKV2T_40085 [Kofleriaceae bacterium]